MIDFAETHGWPVVLKAPRGGYDGRGVWVVEHAEDLARVLASGAGSGRTWLVEEFVRLERELAVVLARRQGGEVAVFPIVETVQEDGICTELAMPAPVEPALAAARQLGVAVAETIGATGVCTVELFCGPGGRLLVNECALRPHNAGHATIEACTTSQFHQHLRAVLDWPLGDPEMVVPAAAMVNLIGASDGSDPAARLACAEVVPGTSVHLYGKPARPGRKLGHVTAVGESISEALGRARRVSAALTS